MSKTGYDSTVATRTRTAAQIQDTPDLLEKFIELGGLPRDLTMIQKEGLTAEAANLGQSQAKSGGVSATLDILALFAALQKEYKSVMGVVAAVKAEIARNGGASEQVTRLEGILTNEAQLTIQTTVEETDEDGAPVRKRKANRSASQEALRAEIAKDAGALLELTSVHEALSERRVTPERLTAMRTSAEKLAGLLAERSSAKGAGKTATQIEHEACARQRDVWGATYRILAALGRQDARVQSMLAEAAAIR